jgi:hypothetical protein
MWRFILWWVVTYICVEPATFISGHISFPLLLTFIPPVLLHFLLCCVGLTLIAVNAQDQCFLLVAGSLFPISLLLDIHTTLTMLLTLSYQRHNLQSSLKCWCLSTTFINLTAVRISYYNFRKCISFIYNKFHNEFHLSTCTGHYTQHSSAISHTHLQGALI